MVVVKVLMVPATAAVMVVPLFHFHGHRVNRLLLLLLLVLLVVLLMWMVADMVFVTGLVAGQRWSAVVRHGGRLVPD